MFKKVLALFLALSIIISLVACGSGTTATNKTPSSAAQTTTAQGDTSQVATNGKFPIVKDKITLTAFAPSYYSVDMKTNGFTKWLEDNSNIHIEWDLAASNDLNEKKSLVLASGNYPDIFLGSFLTKDEEMLYGSQGILLPLNSYIDKYGIEFKKALVNIPIMKNGITTPNGDIYSLPRINDAYHAKFYRRAWINQTWLDKLELKTPETTDELYEVLKAFKEKDPNGNGKPDEIALTGSTGLRSNVADFFINSFIYNDGDGNDRLLFQNGKVDINANKPEFKKALQYLNKLYTEGLIDSAAFTQDDKQLLQLGSNPDAEVLGIVPNFVPWGFAGVDANANNRSRDYVALKPLKGPDGAQFASWYPYQYTFATGFFAITNKCKNPEAAFKLVDYLYSEEGTLRSVYGVEGKDWRYAKNGEIGIDGKPAIWAEIRDATAVQNDAWGEMGPSYRSELFRNGRMAPLNDPWDSEVRLYNETKNKMDGFQPKEVFPPVYIQTDKVSEVARLKTAINDQIKEAIARFITGDLNLEEDWDTYVKQLDSLGLAQYLSELQKAYDAQYKK